MPAALARMPYFTLYVYPFGSPGGYSHLFQPSGLSLEPTDTLLSRSRQWLLQHHQDKDKIGLRSKWVNAIYPDGLSPDMVHFLVVTNEGESIS